MVHGTRVSITVAFAAAAVIGMTLGLVGRDSFRLVRRLVRRDHDAFRRRLERVAFPADRACGIDNDRNGFDGFDWVCWSWQHGSDWLGTSAPRCLTLKTRDYVACGTRCRRQRFQDHVSPHLARCDQPFDGSRQLSESVVLILA